MILAGMWLQTTVVPTDYVKYMMIFIAILTLALAAQAIGILIFAARAMVIIKDLKASVDEAKVKALPLVANMYDITLTTQSILTDIAPKIKIISENATEVSYTVRQTVDKLDNTLRQTVDKATVTFDDANFRTQRQVARVDSMVASTLAATSEIASSIHEGIRVPIRKVAEMAEQSKHFVDTLIVRAKAVGVGLSAYMNHRSTEKHEDVNRPDW